MPKLVRGIQYVPRSSLSTVSLFDLTDGSAYQSLLLDGTGSVTELAHGTSGFVLTSNGPSADPSWQAASGGSVALDDLTDVNTGTPGAPEDGYVLTWVNGSSEYQLAAAAGGSGLTYAQDDTDHLEGLYTTFVAFETDSLGIVVNGVDTDVQPRINFLDSDGGTQVGNIRATSTGFVVDNRRTSGHLLLRAKDAASAVVNLFEGDPDGAVDLYYDNNLSFSTATDGIAVTGGSGTDPHVRLYDTSGGTVQGQFVHSGDILLFDNRIASGTVRMRGVNAASATSNIIIGDPDADCALYYNGTNTFKTTSLGISIESATGSDGEIRFNENSVLTSRIFYDTSLGIWKYRMQTAGDTFRIEEGNGTNVSAEFTPNAGIELYYAGDPTLYVQSGGIRVRGQSTSADVEFADSGGTQLGRLVATSTSFSFGANGHGATVSITGENSGGTPTFLYVGDPDGDFQLYNAGSITLESDTLGVNIRDTGGDNPLLKMQSSGGTDAGWLYFGATGGYIRNFQDGQNFRYLGNNAGGTSTTMLEIDPDGAVDLYNDGNLAFSTTSIGVDIRSSGADPYIRMYNSSGTRLGDFAIASSNMVVDNRVNSGHVIVRGRTAAAGTFAGLTIDPDVGVGFNNSSAAAPQTYTLNATSVVDRTLLASASATTTNNNNVLAALITDLKANGLIN